MNKSIFLILGIIYSLSSIAQSYEINNSPIFKHLYNSKNEIGTISISDKLELLPIKVGNQKAKFKLIKNKNGLYALVDGTGQVYKATELQKDFITFTRVDSTKFYGNSFESINFSYNGIIYTFGGYGFWSRHGQLSHFTHGAEWSIDKINKTYHTLNKFYSYLPFESKLYYIEFPWKEESTPRCITKTSVIEFDINKKENKLIGSVNPKIDLSFKYISIDLPNLKGILSYNEREIYLYQFQANKVYKLTNKNIKESLTSKADAEIQIAYEDEGNVFYSFVNDTTLRTFNISMKDFTEESYPLFIQDNFDDYNWKAILLLIILSGGSFLFFYFKRKNRNSPSSIKTDESYSVDLNSNEFNSIEISLINKLIEQSKVDSYLTVDEMNAYLGIKKKSIEIQKRVRTEAINRINHKFNINFNQETTFIERTRSAEDRRYFNYIINKENVKIYLKK